MRSGGQPIPGATVTAKQGSTTVSTVTDEDGHYGFPLLGPGAWDVSVDMWGFDAATKQVDFADAHGPVNFDLKLKDSPFLQRFQQSQQARQGSNNPIDQALEESVQPPAPGNNTAQGSGDTLLLSGSLSPGMQAGREADSGPDMRFMGGPGGGDITGEGGPGGTGGPQPGFGGGGGFGGPGGGGGGRGGGFGGGGRGGNWRPGSRRGPGAAYGNRAANRRNQIHGMLSLTLENSALNAKPFSLNGLDIPQASYAQTRFSAIVGGPLVLGKLIKDPKTQFFITYFGTRAKTPELFAETVPTPLERLGNFSQAVQSLGTSDTAAPVVIYNPGTKQPFPGNQIPSNLLNPISMGLLNFYPLPNQPGLANNYQFETAQAQNTDNLGVRIQRNVTAKDRLALNFQFQDRNSNQALWFGNSDTVTGYGLNAQVQWTRNLTSTAINTLTAVFNRNRTQLTPYFSTLPDIASELGIPGTSNNPINNGPPTLNFTNFASLNDSTASLTRNQKQGATEGVSLVHGNHTFTLGFSYTRADLSTNTDPNGRGTFSFTGIATSELTASGQPYTGTGYDLADFLLGLPQSSSIRYGDSANYFYENQFAGWVQDEWKVRPDLTIIAGLRYEFFPPFAEKDGHMANLDIAPGYANVAVVLPGESGPYSGVFPSGLVEPDRNNLGPRIALAYKLPFKKSTVIRTGYGIYYNEQAYINIASQLAQQPPFAVSNAVNTSVADPLTLSGGFLTTAPSEITNTFAVDKNYRTPYAQTYNVNIQRDLGTGWFAEIGYQATKGTRLDVRSIPNEAPPGSSGLLYQTTQLGQASGFTYDQSIGDSTFNALQTRLVRRFNHGISINAFYQFAKSIDDASSFGGAGATVAQNWLDIAAERGLSSFDVRHEFQSTFVWTSPAGAGRSRISADSALGRLLKDWQVSGGITAQTGNPLTARVLGNTAQLAQTGGIGSERADATGEPIDSGSGFFNLDAFTVVPAGQYGNAGRNTIPGPGLFSLNAAFARSFTFAERKRLEFRVESNNVLNHVNYTNLYTVVNSVNYGLPSAAGAMRTLDAVVRFRF